MRMAWRRRACGTSGSRIFSRLEFLRGFVFFRRVAVEPRKRRRRRVEELFFFSLSLSFPLSFSLSYQVSDTLTLMILTLLSFLPWARSLFCGDESWKRRGKSV